MLGRESITLSLLEPLEICVCSMYLNGQHTGVFRAAAAPEKASGQTREDGTW